MRSVFAGVVLVLASPAFAQSMRAPDLVAMVDDAPRLAWRAPEGCPDLASLRRRVELRLERPIDDVVLGIEIDVAHIADSYVARIDLRATTVASDVRTLKSKRCGELADAVAVIVARVANDAIARKRTAVQEDVRDEYVVEPPAVPAAPRTWTLGVRVSGVSGIGVIPQVGVAAEVAATLRHNDWLYELAGTTWIDSYAQFHDGAPRQVNVFLDTATARFGWRPRHMPLRAWTAVELGLMGSDTAAVSEQVDGGRWIAAGVGFAVAWQMTDWLRLVGSNETMLAIDRARFTMGNGLVVYAPSPMSFRASVGLELGWQ